MIALLALALGARAEDDLRLWVQPGYLAAAERQDTGWLSGGFEARFDELWLGGSVESEARDLGGIQRDVTGIAAGRWRRERFTLEGSAELTPDPDFSPGWAAWAEPGLVAGPAAASLRAWWMDAGPGGALLLSPAATFYAGNWILSGRYYRSWSERPDPGNAGLARVYYAPGGWGVLGGVGAGDQPDYVAGGLGADGYALGMAGAWWEPSSQLRAQIDVTVREDRAGELRYREAKATLTQTMRF